MSDGRGRVTEKHPIRVGQVWEDNDPRAEGRTFEVLDTYLNGALCRVLTDRNSAKSSRVGWTFLALEKRFRPNNRGTA